MSTIKVINVQNPSAASAAITLDTNGQATLNGLAYPTSGSLSGRNRIINGDMRIDQRNAGASISLANSNGYAVDRHLCFFQGGATGTLTFQRDSVAPAGFTNSIKATVVTADTTNTQAYIAQFVEGYNVADLNFGTANARTVTLSFWVRSSIAGTYCGGITGGGSSGNQVGYVFEYSISSANTWEYKTVTIPGETSGTYVFDSTNGTGFRVKFDLGTIDPSRTAAPNAWTAGLKYSTTTAGVVRWKQNAGATFYITGVQLEVGSVATPFERRSYGQELSLCQRYCQVHRVSSSGELIAVGVGNGATTSTQTLRPFVEFRSTPSLDFNNSNNFQIQRVGAATTQIPGSLNIISGSSNSKYIYIDCGISGGVAGEGQFLRSQNSSAVLILASEL